VPISSCPGLGLLIHSSGASLNERPGNPGSSAVRRDRAYKGNVLGSIETSKLWKAAGQTKLNYPFACRHRHPHTNQQCLQLAAHPSSNGNPPGRLLDEKMFTSTPG
jgi:hypothetical protein